MSLSSLKRAIKQLSSPQGHPGSGALLLSKSCAIVFSVSHHAWWCLGFWRPVGDHGSVYHKCVGRIVCLH